MNIIFGRGLREPYYVGILSLGLVSYYTVLLPEFTEGLKN